MSVHEKIAGTTLDWYDDNGATLKRIFPNADALPECIKTASIRPREQLANEQYALVALDSGHVLRKYAMHDAGTTAMSVIYFMEHGDKLPDPARKVAAARLSGACAHFGLLAPEALLKTAEDPVSFRQQRMQNKIEDIASAQRARAGITGAALGGLAGMSGAQHFGGGAKAQLVAGGATALAGGVGGYLAQRRNHERYGVPIAIRGHARLPQKTANLQEMLPGPIDFGVQDQLLQAALAQHEAHETPEEEALEQQTGMEAHPDEIVGPGPAGFMGGADINIPPELQAQLMAAEQGQVPLDITGQAPMPKLATARPRSDADYAVVTAEGRRLYPIDTWDNVKLAHAYFEENERRMEAPVRRQFATKLASRATHIGYELPLDILNMGAETYADDDHLRAASDMRKVAFPRRSEEHRFLDELFEKRAEMQPEVYAECLRRFDILHDMDKAWDSGFLNPWDSTFGLEKNAHVVWENGAERVTKAELQNLSDNGSIPLQTVFTQMFATEYQKDPIGVFNKLPEAQKKILARMAVDVSSQGGSEGELSKIAGVIPFRRRAG